MGYSTGFSQSHVAALEKTQKTPFPLHCAWKLPTLCRVFPEKPVDVVCRHMSICKNSECAVCKYFKLLC